MVNDLPHKNYVPSITNDFCVIEKMGAAWLFGGYTYGTSDAQKMCATNFYWSMDHATAESYYKYISTGGIPMLWCDFNNDVDMDWYKVAYQFFQDYEGVLLYANEPDGSGQCNRSPLETAIMLRMFQHIAPHAKLIGPNISQLGLEWFAEFLDAYKNLYGSYPQPHRFALHYYTIEAYDPFPVVFSEFCTILEDRGYACDNIWITEFGSCEKEGMAEIAEALKSDLRIEKMFVFSNRHVGCLSIFSDDGSITDVGKAYMEIIRN